MPDLFKYFSDSRSHSFEGVTVLRVALRYPQSGIGEIDTFYAELAQRIATFASERLFPALCEEYSADPDPRRRFVFGYIYRLDCRVTSSDEETASVTSTLTLRRKNSSTEIFCQSSEHIFRLCDGCLLHFAKKSKF